MPPGIGHCTLIYSHICIFWEETRSIIGVEMSLLENLIELPSHVIIMGKIKETGTIEGRFSAAHNCHRVRGRGLNRDRCRPGCGTGEGRRGGGREGGRGPPSITVLRFYL